MANLLLFATPRTGARYSPQTRTLFAYEEYKHADALAEAGHEVGLCKDVHAFRDSRDFHERKRKIDVFIVSLSSPEGPSFIQTLRATNERERFAPVAFGEAYMKTPLVVLTRRSQNPFRLIEPDENMLFVELSPEAESVSLSQTGGLVLHPVVEAVHKFVPPMTFVEKAQAFRAHSPLPPSSLRLHDVGNDGRWRPSPSILG